jgi:hypothetical protein
LSFISVIRYLNELAQMVCCQTELRGWAGRNGGYRLFTYEKIGIAAAWGDMMSFGLLAAYFSDD